MLMNPPNPFRWPILPINALQSQLTTLESYYVQTSGQYDSGVISRNCIALIMTLEYLKLVRVLSRKL